jgi:hypothetical protein
MGDFSELLAGEAHRLQPNDPPPFDELVRTRRLRDRRNRLAAGTLMLLAVAGIAVTATLFGPTRSTTNTATPPSRQTATTSTPTTSVTARLTLSATTVRAGETLTGQITVENNTGDPIRVGGCASIYQVSLVGGDHQGAPPSPLCLRDFTIPVGHSTYPVKFTAAYDSCSMIGNQSKRCPDNGHMPPLPYGEYAATTFASDDQAPRPEPVAVTVLP